MYLVIIKSYSFYRAMPWQDVRLSVCPSVRPSARLSYVGILSKRETVIHVLKVFSPSVGPPFLFFHTKRDGTTSTGPNGGVECKVV